MKRNLLCRQDTNLMSSSRPLGISNYMAVWDSSWEFNCNVKYFSRGLVSVHYTRTYNFFHLDFSYKMGAAKTHIDLCLFYIKPFTSDLTLCSRSHSCLENCFGREVINRKYKR